jgi:hypothetical protein
MEDYPHSNLNLIAKSGGYNRMVGTMDRHIKPKENPNREKIDRNVKQEEDENARPY